MSLIAVACVTRAAEKLDLDRVVPVPATEPIPVQDFFRPWLLQQPTINLAGTHVAAVASAGEDRHYLLVYELDTQKVETVSGPGDWDVYQVNWLNNSRVVFQLSARKLYGVGLMAAEVGSLTAAYPLLQYYSSGIVAVPPKNRTRPLVWNRYNGLEEGSRHDLGVAVVNTDLKNGKIVNLVGANVDGERIDYARADNDRHILRTYPLPNTGVTMSYYADREGELRFCTTADDGVVTLRYLADDHWEKCPVDLDEIGVLGCGDEPGELVVLGPRQDGKPRAVQFMDGASGKLGDLLFQDSAYDFFGGGVSNGWLYRDPVHQRIIGAVFEKSGPHVVWFTEEYRGLQKALDKFFPGLIVRIVGSDEAQKRFLVATFSDRQPVVYNWVDLEKRSVGLIKRTAPWIDAARMQPMSVIKFKTRDGRRLDAYVTLPAGATKANPPPLVVLSHGGPWARDTWGFNAEVQFLVSRGYAVMQPNYRGSNGTSWLFPETDRFDFLKMHEDVTDATQALIASGLIDRERVAIMGTSFGGYLAIAGVANETGLYRCAVAIAGVFDWEQLIRDKKYNQFDSPEFGYLLRKLGDPKQEPAKFQAISPGRRADKIRVPVFVSGGKDDQTVDIEQSRSLLSALDRNNVPHEAYIVSEEGHGMQHLDKQVELYTRVEAFLAKYLVKAKTTVAAAGPP